MSKLLAVTYSFLILIQSFNINLEDISKFSALLEHASFHKEMYGDTFLDFLAEHYGEAKDKHENSHKEHGGKWITNSGFIGELNVGIGRNVISNDENSDDLVGKIGVSIGYRF